jgi:hypothetical protein
VIPTWIDWAAVALLGGLVGISELISRYKDAPAAALRSAPAIFYIAINAAASALALMIIHRNPSWFTPRWQQVLAAGISSMALFRTSLFTVRAGDRDIGVGPSSFLQIFLHAADRAVDRVRAAVRSNAVGQIMDGLDYEKAFRALPPFCLALMQNLSDEDQQALAKTLAALNASDVEPAVKLRLLGLALMNAVGVDVLTAAVGSLKDQIRSGG